MAKIKSNTGKQVKGNFHRPEGAGNFDNMDDMNIVNQVNTKIGTVDLAPTDDKHIVNKKYVDDQIATKDDHNELGNLNWADAGHTFDTNLNIGANNFLGNNGVFSTGAFAGDTTAGTYGQLTAGNIGFFEAGEGDYTIFPDLVGSDKNLHIHGNGTGASTLFCDVNNTFPMNLDLTGGQINHIADPSADQDAATKKYVDDNDANTTYLGGTNLTLAGTTFNVDDAFLKNDGDDTTTGNITSIAPTSDLHLATKKYVDDNTPASLWTDNGTTLSPTNDENILLSSVDPEIKLTDTGNSEYTRVTKTDTTNVAQRLNRVYEPGSTISDLLGHWKMNDNTSTAVIVDSSTYGLDGTYVVNNTEDVTEAGKINTAMGFAGGTSNKRIEVADNARWDFADEFTICFWGKANVTDGGRCVYRYDAGSQDGYYIADVAGTSWLFTTFVSGANRQVSSDSAPTGDWEWICCTRSSAGLLTMYVDNVAQADTETLAGAIDSNGKLLMGIDSFLKNEWGGTIDDVRIYGKELSSAERGVIFNSGDGTESNQLAGANTEVNVWKSEDGVADAEEGILTVGDTDGKTILAGSPVELETAVYKDINLGGATLQRAAANNPGLDEFKDSTGTDTGITTFAFAATELVSGSFEIQHDYEEGTDITPHVHWQGIAAPTGTDKVQWQIIYTLARDGVVLAAPTTIVAECDFDTQYENMRTDFTAITGTDIKVGDQFLFQLQRIAATSVEYAGDALVATVGIHYQVDTLGSRTIITK